MFTIKAKTLCQLLTMVSEIDDECRINSTDTGLSIKIVDPANVAMGIFEVMPEEFENQDPIVVDVNKILRILKHVDYGESCVVYTDDGNTYLKAGHRLLDITHEDNIRKEPRIPTIELPMNFKISPVDLKTDVKCCEELGDHVEFLYSSGIVKLQTMGEENLFHSEYIPEIKTESDMRSLYSIDYLVDIVSSFKYKKEWVCNELKLSFANDFPLMIEGITDQFTFKFLLAPRIEAD